MSTGRIGAISGVSRDDGSAARESAERARDERIGTGPGGATGARGQGAEARPKNARLEEVARLYETQFLREMVKAMRGTVGEGYMKPSMGERIYREQLDNEYVEAWGQLGGVGFAEVIYDELTRKIFGGDPSAAESLKKQGPIALSDRDVLNVARVEGGRPKQVPMKVEVRPGEGQPAKVQSPWDAEVVTRTRLEGGRNAVVLEHGPGVRSTLVFDGVLGAVEPGQRLKKGTAVGVLSPEINSFFWQLTEPHLNSGPGKKLAGPDAAP